MNLPTSESLTMTEGGHRDLTAEAKAARLLVYLLEQRGTPEAKQAADHALESFRKEGVL